MHILDNFLQYAVCLGVTNNSLQFQLFSVLFFNEC